MEAAAVFGHPCRNFSYVFSVKCSTKIGFNFKLKDSPATCCRAGAAFSTFDSAVSKEKNVRKLGNVVDEFSSGVHFIRKNWRSLLDVNFWVIEDFRELVDAVNEFEPLVVKLSDSQLREKTNEFRRRRKRGESLDDIQAEAFAVVREAAKRTLGLRHFDVQIIGGGVLHAGAVAEMQTGEGKTLVSTLAAYLNALDGLGVHVITVNDYLALRDSQWMGRVHRFLGLTVGVIQDDMDNAARKAAYACDITYANNSALGFDYLRDNLARSREEQVFRWPDPFNFAIIDEIDSVIIDDGRLPLIIAKQSSSVLDVEKCKIVAFAVEKMKRNNIYQVLYRVDVQKRDTEMTKFGATEAWKYLVECGWSRDSSEEDIWAAGAAAYLKNALHVEEFLVEGRDYFVVDGAVKIIDPLTGRLSDRSWSGGIHQAVEAKESRIRARNSLNGQQGSPRADQEGEISITMVHNEAARITWKQLAGQYRKLSGMTGTAKSEKVEFMNSVGMPVVTVPPNKPRQRIDYSPIVYSTLSEKWSAVAQTALQLTREGRPVLIGTSTLNDSERLSEYLKELSVPHNVLNARPENAMREASIVAQAGRASAVTIATNMAGRGTDILLGGNPEMLAKEILVEEIRAHIGRLFQREIAAAEDPFFKQIEFSPTAQGAMARTKVLWALTGIPVDGPDARQLFEDLLTIAGQLSRQEIAELARFLQSQSSSGLADIERRIASVADIAGLSMAAELGRQLKSQTVLTLGLMLEECRRLCRAERQLVLQKGGLHVIGTEFQESQRLNDQLKGRAGRQGDPGSSQIVISLEDRLFQDLGMNIAHLVPSGMPLPYLRRLQAMWSARLRELSSGSEKYDAVMEAQRQHVYSLRQFVIQADSAQLDRLLQMFIQTQIHEVLSRHCPLAKEWQSWQLGRAVRDIEALAGMQEGAPLSKGLHLTEERLRMVASGELRAGSSFTGVSGSSLPGGWDFLDQNLRTDSRNAQEIGRLRGFLLEFLWGRHLSAFSPMLNQTDVRRTCIVTELDVNWQTQIRRSQRLWEASLLRGFGDVDTAEEFKIAVSSSFLEMMRTAVRSAVTLTLDVDALMAKSQGSWNA